MMLKKSNCFILAMVLFLCGKSSASEAQISLKYRLPRNIKPINYDLEIFTSLEASKAFQGQVNITVKCEESTDQVILHQNGLTIERNVQIKQLPVVTDPPSIIEVQKRQYDLTNDLYKMQLKKSMEKGTNYEIELKFSGYVSITFEGLVLLAYEGTSGSDMKRIIHTRLDKFGARRIFPCFDELGMKATFTVRIGRHSTMQGFSSTILRVTEPASFSQDWFIDEFEKTVLMEASAVAIVVAALPLASETLVEPTSNTEIQIYADSSILRLQFINEIAFDIFQFFLYFFKISYPLKKLDLFVLPSFSSRASSSYGVIYFSETTLIAASKNPSSFEGFQMVSELCHIISKQWIGYTATMSNFEDEYLHIALNLFLQTICVCQMSLSINPNWEVTFTVSSIIASFFSALDLFTFSSSIYTPILLMGTDTYSIFDYTYMRLSKAYHLIRMIFVILGRDMFKKSITNYLRKFEFDNSNANDLWDAFTNTAMEVSPDFLVKYNFNIRDVAVSWIDQKGYPLVTILRNDETNQLIISQRPFYSFDAKNQDDQRERCWLIPLNYTTKSKSRSPNKLIAFSEWSTCKGPTVMEIDVPRDDWILFDLNVNSRINYDESNWELIQKALISKNDEIVFDALTRARLTSDMFALAEVGELSYKVVLDAMKFLSLEVHFETFKLAFEEFDKIDSRLMGSNIYKSFQKYVRKILNPVFNREEFKNLTEYQTETNMEFKTLIIQLSCKFGVSACVQQSQKIIEEWRSRKGESPKVPKEVYDTIHCQAVKYGNLSHWEFMWNFAQDLKAENKRSILRALACTTSVRLLKRFLNWSIDDKKVSKADSHPMFSSLLFNRKGYNLMKTFFISRYDEIHKFHGNDMTFSVYWTDLFHATVKQKDLYELENLAISKKVALVIPGNILHKYYEKAKKNVEWLSRSKDTFDKYFKNGIFNWRF